MTFPDAVAANLVANGIYFLFCFIFVLFCFCFFNSHLALGKSSLVGEWKERALRMSNIEGIVSPLSLLHSPCSSLSQSSSIFIYLLLARAAAKQLLGQEIFWCWEKPRGREGYYGFQAGVDASESMFQLIFLLFILYNLSNFYFIFNLSLRYFSWTIFRSLLRPNMDGNQRS